MKPEAIATMTRRPITSSSAAASTRWSARRCLPARAAKVLVLERNDRIGGCIRTEEITAPGFVHDVMATTFVLFITSPAYAALAADLGRHGLEFCHTDTPTGVLRPDGSHAVLSAWTGPPTSPPSTRSRPATATSHGRDVGEIERNAGLLFGLLGGGLWTYPTFKLLAGEAWRRGPRGLAAFLGEALSPARGWLESGYQSEAIARAVGALGAACRARPGRCLLRPDRQGHRLRAGGGRRADRQGRREEPARRLRGADQGTRRRDPHRRRRRVDRPGERPRHRRAPGVGRDDLRRSKSVICSVTPTQLYERLLGGATPADDPDAVKNYRYGKGNFQIHYALDRPPAWRGEGLGQGRAAASDARARRRVEGLQRGGARHAAGGADDLRRPAACARSVALSARARRSCGCNCRRRRATSRAMPPASSPRRPTANGTRRCARPMPIASRRSSPAISTASSDSVIARRAYSPADLEAMNINLVGGDPYGGSSTIDQSFLWRPFKGSVNHETAGQGPLPHRRLDPSGRGPRRRLRLPAGAEAVMDQKVARKARSASRPSARSGCSNSRPI